MSTLVLTGVNRGIGEGVALRFLRAGWRVVGLGRTAPEWASEFEGSFLFIPCDLADHAAVERAVAVIQEPIDVLLCSAASFGATAFHLGDFAPAGFMQTLAINLVSPAILAKHLLDRLLDGGQRLIVMMSTGNASLSGNVEGGMLAYRTSKSGLNQLVRNLAAECGGRGLTTVALNPGWVRTDMGGMSAPLSVSEASDNIFEFICDVASPQLNGAFVNTNGSALPW